MADEAERRKAAADEAVQRNRASFRSRVEIHLGDCIAGMQEKLADESVHCLITSIPFGALFSYSHKPEDVGNNRDGVEMAAGQFGLHMRFWFAQVARVMAPGCVVCIHVQQLNTTKIQHGHQGLRDFRGAVIDMARKHGLNPHGEVAIPKNPQRVAQVRKLNSLLFVQGRRDSRALAPANNDFVLFFRKPGDGTPVLGLYDDVKNPRGQFTQEEWIRWARGTWEDGWKGEAQDVQLEGYADALAAYLKHEWMHSGVWGDIVEIDTLQGWRDARETDEERHVCPLQLEVIRRCMLLYTNPGDLVCDPYMGIGSTAYIAVELGRDCVGWELKESYHAMALRNVEKAQGIARGQGQAEMFEEAR
jgi:DNA modification methylase